MLLKYLDIQGFKSFPDKTRVTFDKGLTAVVGPNGSGKSNISDAVRWVMGEQSTKTLRGTKMEDVIFAGTKTRKSQGFAEVSLTVDNSNREFDIDSDEVTITRRYYRSGESDYMINRNNVRLKDINEMFMDTGLGKDGYSLVGQGRIAEIVRSKSNERREIFEEAAGISKFRYRKNESERSLANAEDNLVRLRDILVELEDRIVPLKEQSEKAKKFIELSDTKKTLEVSIWIDTIERSNQLIKDQSDKILVSTNKCKEIEEQIENTETAIQDTFKKMQDCLVEIEQKRKEKEEIESSIAAITADIAVCENDIRHNCENADRIGYEIENHNKAIINTNEEIEIKNQKISETKLKISQIEEEINQKQEELLNRTGESEHLTLKQTELTEELNKQLILHSQLKMTSTQLKMNIDELESAIARNDIEHSTRKKELDKYIEENLSADEFMTTLNEKYEQLNNSLSGHKMKLENRRQKFEQIKTECETSDLKIKEKRQKAKLLEGLENNLEGFAYSVKEVVKRSKNGVLSGVQGTVSQLIEVNSEYSVAIETALGSAMQNIIVDNEGNAKAAIRMLQQQNLGRATFLPLTSVKGSEMSAYGISYSGYINIASKLVTYDDKYRPVIESLLGRIVIVDDIDTAVLIAQKNGYKFRIVTLDGQVVNTGGSLTGGSRNKSQGFLSRKNDIIQLNNEIDALSLKHNDNTTKLNSLKNEVSQIEAEYIGISSEIKTINEDKIRLESEQKRLKHMIDQTTELNNKMQRELEVRKEKLSLNNENLEKNKLELDSTEQLTQKLAEELEQLQLSSKNRIDEQKHLADELSEFKIKIIELNKDIQAEVNSIDELNKNQNLTDEKAKELEKVKLGLLDKNNEISNKINELKELIENNKNDTTDITAQITEIMDKRQNLEANTTELRRNERELTNQKEKLSSETVRLEERHLTIQKEYDEIIAKLWDEYELTRSEAQSFAVKLDNITKAISELNGVKAKIRNLGSVNVAAIEEYKEVNERYEFLSGQVKDAEKARNELLKLINELTQKMQDIFAENFNKINYHFQKIFVELFGGGRADLKLTEPDNLLESGIEIFVEPPGKIIKNLASLSGGEQAFVAIAIYFAILKVRPAPFCILDEIEAALDDVNVVKYANYLRLMSDNTQFIMITHRRGTMEAADVLYGVTMQDEGVSKLLQLKVSEIEHNQALKNLN